MMSDKNRDDIIYVKKKNDKIRFTADPSVIDDKLILEMVRRQYEENKMPNFDRFEFIHLRVLALSFQNIHKIANLEGLTNLETLKLDNNIIEDIESIGHLTKIKWLDLSFNCIKEIKGLDNLSELQDLSLYNNEISVLKGLDKNNKLNVLSIGNNKFETTESVYSYLVKRKFKSLDVLNVAGNPFCKKETDYKYVFLLYLDKLKYIDYELVDEPMRGTVQEKYREDYEKLTRERHEEQKVEEDLKEKQARRDQLKSGFLDHLETLTKEIFEVGDVELLRKMEGAADEYKKFIEKVEETLAALSKSHLEKTNSRRAKMNQFAAELQSKIKSAESESKDAIAKFENEKKHLFREIDYEKREKPTELNSLNNKLQGLEKTLMEIELAFVEMEDEGIKTIQSELEFLTQEIIGRLNDEINMIKEYATQLIASLTTIANNEQKKYEDAGENVDPNMDEELAALYDSRDSVTNALQGASDSISGKIFKKQAEVDQSIRDEKDKFVKNLKETQYTRNRKNVKHINTIIAKLRAEIEKRMPDKNDDSDDSGNDN